jgi:KDO2-lipid IV(A) lauroyltransferase
MSPEPPPVAPRRPGRRRPPGFFGGEPRSESSDAPVSLLDFLGPRYWRAWILIGWLKLAVLLPWRVSLALHERLGRWIGQRSRKSAALVLGNLEICFPELDQAARDELAGRYHANMGAIVAELALAWFGSLKRLEGLFEIQGDEHLARALEGGRGVILCAGHFTPVEICTLAIKRYAPRYALIYNQRRSRLLSEYQRRCRARYADESFPKRNVRAMLRSLGRNAVVWYAADEAHTGKSSALLPFFGEPALTNTALSRLARISGAAVVPLFYCRKDDDSGYLIRFGPALEGFPSDDVIADTLQLTALLEASIRECPAQYFWKQRRFRGRRGEDARLRTLQ